MAKELFGVFKTDEIIKKYFDSEEKAKEYASNKNKNLSIGDKLMGRDYSYSKVLIDNDATTQVPVEKIKNGEYVRIQLNGKTYTKQKFDRENKKYELQGQDDIGNFKYVKKGTLLWVGFEY